MCITGFRNLKQPFAKETMMLPGSIVRENIPGAGNQETVKNFEGI